MIDYCDTKEMKVINEPFSEHYEILQSIETLAENDYHEVYAARHRMTGVLVCVKKIYKERLADRSLKE